MYNQSDTEKETMDLIKQSLNIESQEVFTHEDMINLIADRVDFLLENDKDLLLSYLYRLDISMKRISHVLKIKNIIPAHQSLALLIYQRQLERITTKKKIKVDPIEGWEY
jgi:hypothetical protein